jgi:uncharacterized protein (TIGR03083 family)
MSAPHRSKDFFLDALRQEAETFCAAVSAERFADPVPSCPEWTVRDLVGHLGSVYRWHASNVSRGVTTKPEGTRPGPPAVDDDHLLRWWQESLDLVSAALEKTEEDTPAWNPFVQPDTARFWHRRVALETAVHRWDAQVSNGLADPIEAPLAVAGVDEVLDSFLPSGRRAGPTDQTGVVRLEATDAEHRWAVRIRGEGLSLLDIDSWFEAEPDAQAAAIGTASDLLLALWGRIPVTTLTIQGRPELVSALRTR